MQDMKWKESPSFSQRLTRGSDFAWAGVRGIAARGMHMMRSILEVQRQPSLSEKKVRRRMPTAPGL
jgi:hypothetical protein